MAFCWQALVRGFCVAWPALGCWTFDASIVSNNPPTVDAGAPQQVLGGQQVTLLGAAQDADGDPLSYRWTQVAGDPIDLSSFTDLQTTFVAPLRSQTLIFSLMASDGIDESAPDLVSVVVDYNRPPVAEAGEFMEIRRQETQRIYGSGTDPDGDEIVGWQWALVLGPQESTTDDVLTGPDSPNPVFQSSLRGEHILELRVFDGELWSTPDARTIVVTNNAPTAVATASPSELVPNIYLLSAAPSHDPDHDPIVAWQWTLENFPASASAQFVDGISNTETVALETVGVGIFELSLQVSDGIDWSSGAHLFINTAVVPVLALAPAQVIVAEGGQVGGLSTAGSFDPDGEDLYFVWTKIHGSPLFPSTLSGPSPTFDVPSFAELLAYGDTQSVYRVIASDGLRISAPSFLTVSVRPASSQFVILSDGDEATDSPACGTPSVPCRSLSYALEQMSSAGVGDGRTLIATSGFYLESAHETDNVLIWPAGVSVYAGRHRINYAASEPSVFRLQRATGSCFPSSAYASLRLGPTVGSDVVLDGFELRSKINCVGTAVGVDCAGCKATLQNAKILVGENTARVVQGARVDGSNADLILKHVELESGGCGDECFGVLLRNGARANIYDSSIRVAATATANLGTPANAAVRLSGGGGAGAFAYISRSTLVVLGPDYPSDAATTAAIWANAGIVWLENSVLGTFVGGEGYGVRQSAGGSASLRFNTIIGSNQLGSGAGIAISGAAGIYGNIVNGFDTAIRLSDESALASYVFSNALSGASGRLAQCLHDDIFDITSLNALSSTVCNQSDEAWSHNIQGSCPLVDALAGNYALNTFTPNVCVGAASASSPAGVAPAVDRLGQPRANPPSMGAFDRSGGN